MVSNVWKFVLNVNVICHLLSHVFQRRSATGRRRSVLVVTSHDFVRPEHAATLRSGEVVPETSLRVGSAVSGVGTAVQHGVGYRRKRGLRRLVMVTGAHVARVASTAGHVIVYREKPVCDQPRVDQVYVGFT